jgi:hypothetical protein
MNVKRVLIMAVLAGFVVVGCGKKDGETAGKEGATKAGKTGKASKSNHDKLQGTWKFNIDKMISGDPKMAEMVKAKPEMKEQLGKMMGDASITIGKDNVTMKGMGKEDKSTYTVVSQEGNKIVIEAIEEGKEKKEKLSFEFTDDDNMKGREDGKDADMYLTRSQ